MDMIFSYLQDAMVAMVAATVCAVIAILAIWKLVSDLFFAGEATKCTWTKDAFQPQDGESHWTCGTCSAKAVSKADKPPTACRMNEAKQAA